MMRTLLTLSLALAAGAAHATGFTTADLGKAAQAADATQSELARATEDLRLAIAYDTALGIGNRSEAERTVLLAALPTGEGAGDLRVAWFMRGAIAQPSQGKTTILYNPLARGTLALDWARDGDNWRVTSAWLSSSGPAQWPATEGPWRKAFAEDYAKARAFEGDAGRELVAFESDRWLGALALALRDPARRTGIERARKLIADGRTAKAGGGSIDLLPAATRATYAPVAAIARRDGGSAVIFGSPAQPQLLIAADFSGVGSLERLNLMNLANAGGAK